MTTKMLLDCKRPERYDRHDYVAMGLLIGILAVIMVLFGSCGVAHAEGIPDDLAIKAVYNEALHDGVSINAMCHALSNRGYLGGVYGAKVNRPIPDKERRKVLFYWLNVPNTKDPTNGATHWLSDYDSKHCKPSRMAWRFKMKETYYDKTGQTHYYKEV